VVSDTLEDELRTYSRHARMLRKKFYERILTTPPIAQLDQEMSSPHYYVIHETLFLWLRCESVHFTLAPSLAQVCRDNTVCATTMLECRTILREAKLSLARTP